MHDGLLTHADLIRLTAFAGVLTMMAFAEWAWPRRQQPQRRMRWPANLGMVVLDTLVVRLLLPTGAVGIALWAESARFGLLWQTPLPGAVRGVFAFVALDCLIYWQHRLLHVVPLLWRLHRVHHSDVEFDATTGVRFHPFEIVLSMLLKMMAVALLGAPAVAVIVFEIALNGTTLFNHSNLHLPPKFDRWLRWVLVTPDMHRVHHSIYTDEYNRNFGFNLPWWDRLFGSYRAKPANGHAEMRIGLTAFRETDQQRLVRLLAQPFAPVR